MIDIEIDKLKREYISICEKINREGIQDLLKWLETSDFYTAPASTKYHDAFKGGLLLHSLRVYHELENLADFYHFKYTDGYVEDSIPIVSLFHDLCKVNFYSTEKRNRKNEYGKWETYDAYTIDEKFCFGGHGSKSVFIVQQFIKLTPAEAAAINTHMGAFTDDWRYVGKTFEQFPLAWLLSVADQAATYIIN